MKKIRYYMLAALATMMLVGCTEDNNMDAIPQPVPAGTPETDEVIKALSDIPGVTNVRLLDEDTSDDYSNAEEVEDLEVNRRAGETAYVPCYSFSFEQPIDHERPELGTYLQACRLRYKGAEKNVVVLTYGPLQDRQVGRHRYQQGRHHLRPTGLLERLLQMDRL